MTILRHTAVGLSLLALACGGGKSDASGPTEPGESGGGDLETPTEGGGGEPGADAGPTEPTGPAAPVTFVLKNSHTTELAFNMDRGWGINIFAYTGKPPKAKTIQMFPKHCTAACDATDEERCPVCEEPEKLKDIKAAQKMEKVAAGGTLEVPWDANQFVYTKSKGRTAAGKTRKCECHAAEPAPPETYTVKACGLRLSTEVGKNTQIQCVESTMTLPATEPIKVEFDFGAPPCDKKMKKAKKC